MRVAIIKSGQVVNVIDAATAIGGPGELAIQSDTANIGDAWDGSKFIAPPPTPPVGAPRVYHWSDADLPLQYWQIDTGPFKDRFDTYGYAGLKGFVLAAGRTNDVCYAAFADLQGREFIDLKLRYTELRNTLDDIAAVVAAAGRPPFTVAMREAILKSPTTDYERHTKGLTQPL